MSDVEIIHGFEEWTSLRGLYIYNVSDIGSFESLWLVCYNWNLIGDVCVVVLYIYITALICNQCLSP